MAKPEKKKALAAIERLGVCLVYPLQNRTDVPSLWHALWPRSAMRWSWDAGSDDRVSELWLLRQALAESGKVAYAKWFRGRATFFSLAAYEAALAALNPFEHRFSVDAAKIRESLQETSPQSTKELKRSTGLEGKFFSKTYDKSLAELWQRLAVVGVGEKDDGAFPSLLIAASELVFEGNWKSAGDVAAEKGRSDFARLVGSESPFVTQMEKILGPRRRVSGPLLGPR